jgi:hypothetical protein
MMETSGHGAIKENYFLDDGAYLAVKVRLFCSRTWQGVLCRPVQGAGSAHVVRAEGHS